MTDVKRSQPLEDLREVQSAARTLKSREHREQKHKFVSMKPREVFLTDSQTDLTKSSNEANNVQIEQLQYIVRKLEKENSELKESILKMKASQFYGINEEKVKNLIKENESLQNQVKILRKELERILIQKDFLERNNKALKEKYQEYTKQNNKNLINSRLKTQFSRINEYQLIQGLEETIKENKLLQKQSRSTSSEKSKVVKKKIAGILQMESKQRLERTDEKRKEGKLHQDYYILKQGKSYRKS